MEISSINGFQIIGNYCHSNGCYSNRNFYNFVALHLSGVQIYHWCYLPPKKGLGRNFVELQLELRKSIHSFVRLATAAMEIISAFQKIIHFLYGNVLL